VDTPYAQRGEGIGSFLAGIFRALEILTIRGARVLDRKVHKMGLRSSHNLMPNNPKQTSRISWPTVWHSGRRCYSPNENETVRHHHRLIDGFGGEEE